MKLYDTAKPTSGDTPFRAQVHQQAWLRTLERMRCVFDTLENLRQSQLGPRVRVMVQHEVSSPVFYAVSQDVQDQIFDQIRGIISE